MSNNSSNTELKNFLPLAKIGQGAFSTVYKVKRITDGQIYALKKIKIGMLKQKQKLNSLNQIRILASLKSKFIISYKEAFYDCSLNLLCIVMEYANGGDLQKMINNHKKSNTIICESQIWKAASQILIGLFILHQKGILHRDLKSANIFISNQIFKLGDLNVSKINYEKDQMAKTQTGTPYYASPQVWRDQPYDNKCDIWSLGCLLYQMCCFSPPFQGSDLDELYRSVQSGKYIQIPSIYSKQLSNLIKLCLKVNPKERPTAKELLQNFKVFRLKYIQSYTNKQIQIQCNLLNTIRLPFDLKDLSKNLPSAEYQDFQKAEPQTKYQDRNQRQTMMLKNRTKQKIQPLPQRIKKHFSENQKIEIIKRPQRPLTSKKITQAKEIQKQKEVRPSSATYINKKLNFQEKIDSIHKFRQERKIIQPQSTNEINLSINRQKTKNIRARPNQYHCKTSASQEKNSKRQQQKLNFSINKKKIKNKTEQNKIQKDLEERKIENKQLKQVDIEKFNIHTNQDLYQRCKQQSLKKISSLEKKVKYIRQQRKQRKVFLQKNKENLSFLIKPKVENENKCQNQQSLDMKKQLQFKLKQNSQIFTQRKSNKQRSLIEIPLIEGRQVRKVQVNRQDKKVLSNEDKILKIDNVDNIKKRLQLRRNNIIQSSRRYIVSSEGRRLRGNRQNSLQRQERAGMSIQIDRSVDRSKLINESIQNIRNGKKIGMIYYSGRMGRKVIEQRQGSGNTFKNDQKKVDNKISEYRRVNKLDDQEMLLPYLIRDGIRTGQKDREKRDRRLNSQNSIVPMTNKINNSLNHYNDINLSIKDTNKMRSKQIELAGNAKMLIQDSETILRLKKRIKNRMMSGSNNRQIVNSHHAYL